jgi:hypothetical protein
MPRRLPGRQANRRDLPDKCPLPTGARCRFMQREDGGDANANEYHHGCPLAPQDLATGARRAGITTARWISVQELPRAYPM